MFVKLTLSVKNLCIGAPMGPLKMLTNNASSHIQSLSYYPQVEHLIFLMP